jgi:hypothetical protein
MLKAYLRGRRSIKEILLLYSFVSFNEKALRPLELVKIMVLVAIPVGNGCPCAEDQIYLHVYLDLDTKTLGLIDRLGQKALLEIKPEDWTKKPFLISRTLVVDLKKYIIVPDGERVASFFIKKQGETALWRLVNRIHLLLNRCLGRSKVCSEECE